VLFFLLVSISAAALFVGLRAQADDALVINLAGRQRMLVQQMTRLANDAQHANARNDLQHTMSAFQEALDALHFGGEVHYPAEEAVRVPPTADAEIAQQLARVENTWQGFQAQLNLSAAGAGSDQETKAAREAFSFDLLRETDVSVRLFQQRADRRVAVLQGIEIAFLISALLLLLTGGWIVSRSILRPLSSLARSARQIGREGLKTPVQVDGPVEVRLLSQTMETMRSDLQESHQELLRLNQTLEDRVTLRTRELDALYAVSQEISSRLNLNQVLQSVTAKARELLKADIAFLCLIDPQNQLLRLSALSGPEETVRNEFTRVRNPFVQTILGDHLAKRCLASDCQGTCGILDQTYQASHLAASLWVENRVIGALCVGSDQRDAFSGEATQLLTRLAGAAAVAIENARLYEQAERVAALEERQRIAAAMHDGLAQMIDSLGLMVDQASGQLDTGSREQAGEILERLLDRIRQASTEVRQSIASLQDEPLVAFSLQQQLQSLVEECAGQGADEIQYQYDLRGQLFIPDKEARQVIGIAQEALNNARRYAGASRIELSLTVGAEEAVLTLSDNGCGFNPDRLPEDGRHHFGLKIQKARAAQLGGTLKLESAPGKGTRLSLLWPIHRLARPAVRQAGGEAGHLLDDSEEISDGENPHFTG